MKNAKELRIELDEVFASVKSGAIDTKVSESLANIAGKMIASAKAQLQYYELRNEAPNIEFLRED